MASKHLKQNVIRLPKEPNCEYSFMLIHLNVASGYHLIVRLKTFLSTIKSLDGNSSKSL